MQSKRYIVPGIGLVFTVVICNKLKVVSVGVAFVLDASVC